MRLFVVSKQQASMVLCYLVLLRRQVAPLRSRAPSSSFCFPQQHRRVACFCSRSEPGAQELDPLTVNVGGLKAEAARRRERAVKKVLKKSMKSESASSFSDKAESEAAMRRAALEREDLDLLLKLLESGDLEAAVEKANDLCVLDRPPERPPRIKKEKGPSPKQGPRVPYNTYVSESGIEIRVGKSASDNDDLSLEHRDPNDWWMHAQGSPGSHVVIRAKDLDLLKDMPDTAKDAACLAALFSKAVPKAQDVYKPQGKAKVSLVRASVITKPPKAKPGLVQIKSATQIATLSVDLAKEHKRLKRLLDTKQV